MGLLRELGQDVRTFCASMSLKGFPRMFTKQKKRGIVGLWGVASLVCLCVTLYQTVGTLQLYFQYNRVTRIHSVTMKDIRKGSSTALNSSPLSAITLCNNRPVPSYQSLSNVWTYSQYLAFIDKTLSNATFHTNRRKFLNFYVSIDGYYRHVPHMNLTDVSYKLEDFLMDCTYTVLDRVLGERTLACKDVSKFRTFSTPEYLNCFTVAVDENKVSSSTILLTMTGILYLDNVKGQLHRDSRSLPESRAGGLVVFHELMEYPDVSQALALPPGFETILQTSQMLYKRLRPPYGDCEDRQEKYYDLQGNEYIYTSTACMLSCLQEHIAHNCTCVNPHFQLFKSLDEVHKYPLCGNLKKPLTGLKQLECQVDVSARMTQACTLKCPLRCRDLKTTSVLGQLRWPHVASQPALYRALVQGKTFANAFEEYENITEGLGTGRLSVIEAVERLQRNTHFSDNFAKFTITTLRDGVYVIEHKAKMTMTDLISQLGGTLNLYSGITFIFGVEVLELLYNFLDTCIWRPHKTVDISSSS